HRAPNPPVYGAAWRRWPECPGVPRWTPPSRNRPPSRPARELLSCPVRRGARGHAPCPRGPVPPVRHEAAVESAAIPRRRARPPPRTVRDARGRAGVEGRVPVKAVSRGRTAAAPAPAAAPGGGASLSGDHAMRRQVASAVLIGCAAACATISTQQEVQMGQQYSQQINQQLPIIQDAEINRYINVLGDSIAKVNDTRNLQWHFYVVDTKEVNAFAVPGGYIYVNRGLIEQTDKMDQLAGVLGHEIGHVLRRHTVKLMEKENAANVGVQLGCILTKVCNNAAAGAAINVAGSAVFASFS